MKLNGKKTTQEDLLNLAQELGYEGEIWSDTVINILEDHGYEIDEEEETTESGSMTNIAWIILLLLLPFTGYSQSTFADLEGGEFSVTIPVTVTATTCACPYEIENMDLRQNGNHTWVTITKGDLYALAIPFEEKGSIPLVNERYYKAINNHYGELRLNRNGSGWTKFYLGDKCGFILIEFIIKQ